MDEGSQKEIAQIKLRAEKLVTWHLQGLSTGSSSKRREGRMLCTDLCHDFTLSQGPARGLLKQFQAATWFKYPAPSAYSHYFFSKQPVNVDGSCRVYSTAKYVGYGWSGKGRSAFRSSCASPCPNGSGTLARSRFLYNRRK